METERPEEESVPFLTFGHLDLDTEPLALRDASNIHSNLIRMLCRHLTISKEDDATLPDVISLTYTAVSVRLWCT